MIDFVSIKSKNIHDFIYDSGELEKSATTEESSVVRMEGKREVKLKIKLYNLDAVISVGYRVNSKKGTRFRMWATQRLKESLIELKKQLKAKGEASDLFANPPHTDNLAAIFGNLDQSVYGDAKRTSIYPEYH